MPVNMATILYFIDKSVCTHMATTDEGVYECSEWVDYSLSDKLIEGLLSRAGA